MSYYKVVTTELKSAIDIAKEIGLETQYIIGEWVKPKIKQAPLMVFGDLETARDFVRSNTNSGPHKLFECSIKPSKKEWGWIPAYIRSDLLKIIKNKKAWRHFVGDVESLPQGTIFADEVMLIREVY